MYRPGGVLPVIVLSYPGYSVGRAWLLRCGRVATWPRKSPRRFSARVLRGWYVWETGIFRFTVKGFWYVTSCSLVNGYHDGLRRNQMSQKQAAWRTSKHCGCELVETWRGSGYLRGKCYREYWNVREREERERERERDAKGKGKGDTDTSVCTVRIILYTGD